MQTIGRYAIEREIGRGEMGTVYLALDPVLDRRVALKTVRIPDGLDEAEREEYLKRFYREAQAAGKLSHHGIVTIFDAGMDEATQSHFIAMEYIAGVSLKQFLADGPRLAPRQAAFIVAGVAEALDYAHAHGVVHRDIKPANIILTDRGAVKLADFGIAKVPSSHLTMEGTYLGTPAYTSPEQVLGKPVNGRSDLFSLGIVLYELLSGRKPFPAENLGQLFHAIAYDPHTPLSEVLPGCPPELQAVTDRALGKEDGSRYAAGHDMARDLRAFLGEGPSFAQAPAGPLDPGPGAVFDGPEAPAANPLANLIGYLEETTRHLAPEEEASEALTTPAVKSAPPSPRKGLRGRIVDGLASRPRWGWLARPLDSRLAFSLSLAIALAGAAVVAGFQAQARRQFPSGSPWPSLEPAASWRASIQGGRTELKAGRIEQGLARFQEARLHRPGSPALAALIKSALGRLDLSLKAQKTPAEHARRLLDLGQKASKRGDPLSAAEFIQAALGVEPANPDAAAARQALEASLKAPPSPPAAHASPPLRLVFDSPVPKVIVTVNVDGTQVLRKSFEFDRKDGGRLNEPVAVAGGRHSFQVWITLKNGESYTAYGAVEGRVRAEGPSVLAVRLDPAAKKLILSLNS